MKPSRGHYKVDLIDLHSLCEANYIRLLRLFADYEQCNERCIVVGAARVMLTVTERCRYTTNLRLQHVSPLASQLSGIELDMRLYHDARMAEVVGFQSHTHVQGRYRYPNNHMYARDEKRQQNGYVADLLAFCLAEGQAPDLMTFDEASKNSEPSS